MDGEAEGVEKAGNKEVKEVEDMEEVAVSYTHLTLPTTERV